MRSGSARRCGALTVESERLEAELAKGAKVDLELLARVAGHIRRLSETLGLDRVKRDAAPTLADLAAKHAKKAAGA